MKKRTKSHRKRCAENESGHTGTDAGKKRLYACVFQQIADERGDDEDNDKRGQNHAEGRKERAGNAAL